jgi:tetratricopeptide (TPR) repeat protein
LASVPAAVTGRIAMNNPHPDAAKYLTILLGGLFLLVAWVVLRISHGLNAGPKPAAAPAKPSAATSKSGDRPWVVWYVLIVFFALMIYTIAGARKRGPAGEPPRGIAISGWACVGAVVAVIVPIVVVFYVIPYLKYRDRAVTRAIRQANDGDLDGAIRELEAEVLANRSSANRANGLGVMLMMQEDWPGACARFREAIELDPERVDLRHNEAIVLMKMGRAAEAEARLAVLASANPREPTILANHAKALIDLGRLDEAVRRISEAEEALSHVKILSLRVVRGIIQGDIDLVKTKLAESRGFKDVTGLEEL